MKVIYCATNIENGKKYIGQTRNLPARKRNHKSDAFNGRSNSYNDPFHGAIRKYGWEKFSWKILAEFDDKESQEVLDEAEKYWIKEKKTLVSEGGYNLKKGGQGGGIRLPLTYEEKLSKSKLFIGDEIQDIQQMLIEGKDYKDIYKKYPSLKQTFLSNINTGVNFNNPKFSYPLYKKQEPLWVSQAIHLLQTTELTYKEICEQLGLQSQGNIAEVNNGNKHRRDDLTYPIRVAKTGRAISEQIKNALITWDFHPALTKTQIYELLGNEFNRKPGSIKKLNLGTQTKKSTFIYPLLSHQEENRKILINQ